MREPILLLWAEMFLSKLLTSREANKHRLIAYFLGNIFVENYQNLFT